MRQRLKKFEERRNAAYADALTRLPKPGAKVRYHGMHERELRIGEVYTLKTIELPSSWASITLEETGDTEFTLVGDPTGGRRGKA